MKSNHVDMLNGSIAKGIFRISLPVMIMNVIQSMFNIVDMSILKMYDTTGGLTVGSIGVCSTLISLITGLMVGISSGSNVLVARHVAKNDVERTEKAVGTSVLFAFFGGVGVATIGIIFARVFLTMMNTSSVLLDGAVLYFRMYFLGVPLSMISSFSAAVLRSTGDAKRPIYFSFVTVATKLLLSFIFVAGLRLNIVGVALATIISMFLGSTLYIMALVHNDSIVRLCFSRLRFYAKELREILFVGVPAGLEQSLYSVANVVISSTVNTFGPLATTGVSIANTFDGVLYQISISPALAVTPYVVQNVAVKNLKRAKRAVVTGMLTTVAIGGGIGALSAIFSPALSSLMSSDPRVIAFSCEKMIIISSTYFICGINNILSGALRGLRLPMVPTVSTFLYMCVLRFAWVYLVFPLYPNLTFLYLVWPIGWIMSILTGLPFYISKMIKLKKQFAE